MKQISRVFFQTPEGMEEYRIAAVLKADVSMFDFQQTSFSQSAGIGGLCSTGESAVADLKHGVAGAGCETTLTLVTCSYEWKEARNILVAVKAEPKGEKCSKVGTFLQLSGCILRCSESISCRKCSKVPEKCSM